MAKIIPNQESWIGFTTADLGSLQAPTAAEVDAATNFTGVVVSINASSTGNTVPTPSLDSLFETSISGTSGAQFSVDMYRDDEDDAAWDTLTRGTKGYFLISRFGGTGVDNAPAAGQKVEVWPVHITSRSAAALSSNTAQTFTVTASVPKEPAEDAVVAA